MMNLDQDPTFQRLEALARDIVGPGMGAAINGQDLNFLTQVIRGQQQEIVKLRKSRGGAATVPEVDDSSHDTAVVLLQTVKDVFEEAADLWGFPLADALVAWSEQRGGEPLPDGWRDLIESE